MLAPITAAAALAVSHPAPQSNDLVEALILNGDLHGIEQRSFTSASMANGIVA